MHENSGVEPFSCSKWLCFARATLAEKVVLVFGCSRFIPLETASPEIRVMTLC